MEKPITVNFNIYLPIKHTVIHYVSMFKAIGKQQPTTKPIQAVQTAQQQAIALYS